MIDRKVFSEAMANMLAVFSNRDKPRNQDGSFSDRTLSVIYEAINRAKWDRARLLYVCEKVGLENKYYPSNLLETMFAAGATYSTRRQTGPKKRTVEETRVYMVRLLQSANTLADRIRRHTRRPVPTIVIPAKWLDLPEPEELSTKAQSIIAEMETPKGLNAVLQAVAAKRKDKREDLNLRHPKALPLARELREVCGDWSLRLLFKNADEVIAKLREAV